MAKSPHWFATLSGYQKKWIASDVTSGLIIAALLVPQAIAYAFLAGLPAQAGLYASLLPILVYVILGTSPALAVGPVAIVSLLTLEVLKPFADPGTSTYSDYASLLALETGAFLLVFYLIDLGRWTSFISHSVVSAFSSAAAILIVLNQLKYLTGLPIPREGGNETPILYLLQHWQQISWPTFLIASGSLTLLFFWPKVIQGLSRIDRLNPINWQLVSKMGPLLAVVLGIVLVSSHQLPVSTVGLIPSGLPTLAVPDWFSLDWRGLLPSAAIIALIGYLEGLAVSRAMKKPDQDGTTARINPNQELLAIGMANISAALSQAYPVAGGFGRSMVNHASGARSQLASLVTLLGIVTILLFATYFFESLPHAVLGAIVSIAVLPLVKFKDGVKAWAYQKADGLVWLVTFVSVLLVNTETGIAVGILLSLMLYLGRSQAPHIAEIGRVGNSDHFRNLERHEVVSSEKVLLVRIDENLYFANGEYLEHYIEDKLSHRPKTKHLILVGSSINYVDYAGYESLLSLITTLEKKEIQTHLAEFKGPVMDQLRSTDLESHLRPGQVFMTASEGLRKLGGV